MSKKISRQCDICKKYSTRTFSGAEAVTHFSIDKMNQLVRAYRIHNNLKADKPVYNKDLWEILWCYKCFRKKAKSKYFMWGK